MKPRFSRTVATFLSVNRLVAVITLLSLLLSTQQPVFAARNDLTGPTGSVRFGAAVYALPNGNFIVIDPQYSPGTQVNIGAVYLYDGATKQLIVRVLGSTDNDKVGSGGVKILADNSLFVVSPEWGNSGVAKAGAVTWVPAAGCADPSSGCADITISAANSLVGSHANDLVGVSSVESHYLTNYNTIATLPSGAYLVTSVNWDDQKGAVTYCASADSCVGVVSSSNSLVGAASKGSGSIGDYIGFMVTLLPGGGYVVIDPYWSNGAVLHAGAITPCPATGCTGVVSTSNSLYNGTTTNNEQVGSSVVPLTGGGFVMPNFRWGGNAGVVAFCSSVTDPRCVGQPISASNSLLGTSTTMKIGWGGAKALPDGGYLILSSEWDDGATTDKGALTYCSVSGSGNSASSSCTGGSITTANSLTGDQSGDKVGAGVVLLSGGAFLAYSSQWHSSTGAFTYCASAAACMGQVVSSSNSLVGGHAGDTVGTGSLVLSSGEYIVFSPYWDPAGSNNKIGAATFCPATGCTGAVSAANSLTGSQANDQVGMAGGMQLTGGAIVIASPNWTNGTHSAAGAVTFCATPADCKNTTVQAANSLVGDHNNDQVGYYNNVNLSNGAYLVGSPYWDNSSTADAGALTWCPATGCKAMTVGATNSLVGSNTKDYVGYGPQDIGDGMYMTSTETAANTGSYVDAVTLCTLADGCQGPITASNSVISSVPGVYYMDWDWYTTYINASYDSANHRLLVGMPLENKVAFFTLIDPPSATTGAAASVATTGATLNGTVNANGASTTVTFAYGLTTGYGSTATAAPSPVTGTSNTTVSAALSGLTPNTTYHYRVVATSAGGTTNGLDGTFTTAAAAPSTTSNDATVVTATSATLNGTVNANNQATTVTFEYGTTVSYGSSSNASPASASGTSNTAVSATISVEPNTTYHFRVVATNPTGTTTGGDKTFTTPLVPPGATTNDATAVTTSGATLNASVTANNANTSITFQYGTTTGYGSAANATPASTSGMALTSASADLNGLTPNTTYHYRVVAFSAGGTTNGSDKSFKTGAEAPTVTTNDATSLAATSATLNGTVNAKNADATVTFQYGLDASYGATVNASPALVTGMSNTSVAVALTGLAPNTTYHFRAAATNAGGTANGGDLTFKTSTLAPAATTTAASGVSTTGATLNGTVNANNETTTITFAYGTTTAYGTTVTATPGTASGASNTAVSAALTGLTPNTTYHFHVVAINGTGTTDGGDQTFTTGIAAPTATTGAASSVSTTGATLNATVNANNAATTISFAYGLTTAYGTPVSATPGTASGTSNTATSAALSGLTPNTTYHYHVVANNPGGSTDGGDQTFTTGVAAPSAATGAATAITTTGATLHGTVNANNAATMITFEYGTSASYGTQVAPTPGAASGTSSTATNAILTGLTPNTTYHFHVMAVNSGGATDGGDLTFTTGAAAPTVTTGSAALVSATSATLNGVVNANNADASTSFEYGLTTSYGESTAASPATASGTGDTSVSAAITSLIPNSTYHFRVVSTNAGGTTYGTDQTFQTALAASAATANPATSVTTTSATLNGSVNANNADAAVTFEYGATDSYGLTAPAAPAMATGTSSTSVSAALTGLIPNTTYHFRVVATNAGGTTNSPDQTFTTAAAPAVATTVAASAITTTGAALNATVNPQNASTTVTFAYGPTASYGSTATAAQSPVSGLTDTAVSVSITGLAPNNTYHYRVVAVNAGGTTNGADQTFTTAPAAPAATTAAASAITTSGATLNGSVNANNASSTVTFEYGRTASYGSMAAATPSPVNGLADTAVSAAISGLSPNTTYHFRVAATNAGGTTYGSDRTFITAPAAPAAATGAASAITATGATLNGAVNAYNASTTVTFAYGPTASYGSTITAAQSPANGLTDTAVSAVLTGLIPNSTYHFRIVATNAGGTTNGTDQTFTTGLAAPAATTGAASSVSDSGATLNASVNAQNASTTVTFVYGLTTSYGTTVTAAQSPVSGLTDTAVSAALTGLIPNTTYHFRIVAVNAGGTTNGADQTFTTALAAPTAKTAAASALTGNGATFNGTVNANNADTTVVFEYGMTTSYTKTVAAAPSPVSGLADTAVSAAVTGLIPNTQYSVRVVAINAGGKTYGDYQIFTTAVAAPLAGTDTASQVTTNGVTLNGTVNPNHSATIVTFEYGLTTSYGNTVTAAQSPLSEYNNTPVSAAVTGLSAATTYHFRVVAVSAGGTTYGKDQVFTTGKHLSYYPMIITP